MSQQQLDPIQIVSLGSGDPRHITLRAYDELTKADEIYCLGSAARQIIERLPEGASLATKCRVVELAMKKDRTDASKTYASLAEQVTLARKAGQAVSVVTIGDAGTYASVQYLCDILSAHQVAYDIIPGVPYYISAVAALGKDLVRQEDSLLLLSQVRDEKQLQDALTAGHVVAVMKLSRCADIVKAVVQRGDYQIIYAEYLGDPERELVTDDRYVLEEDYQYPYFSLMIIRPERIAHTID